MYLVKLCGQGGEWITEEKKHNWNGILKYISPTKAEVGGKEVPVLSFVSTNADGNMTPVFFPVSFFPSNIVGFFTTGEEYVVIKVNEAMIEYFKEKYKNVAEDKWPKGLKEMLIEQTLIFQVGHNEVAN